MGGPLRDRRHPKRFSLALTACNLSPPPGVICHILRRMGSAIAPVPGRGGPLGPQRIVPPLPAGIPIMPGQATTSRAARRFPVGLIILLVFAGLGGLAWFNVWYSDYDTQRIDPAVKRAILAHATKGTRIPVTLWSGPRILQIDFATVQVPPRVGLDQGPPTTCVSYSVLDPKTGAQDNSSRYAHVSCIEGIAYRIH